jgi:hypothetical protein
MRTTIGSLSRGFSIKTLWKNGSYKNRQNLQKLVFPDGLIWDKETDKPRTIRENEALMFMRSLSSTYEKWSKEKTGKSCDFSGLVDQTLKFSNLLEDLWKVERFMQYIENQGSENMIEMEGSER